MNMCVKAKVNTWCPRQLLYPWFFEAGSLLELLSSGRPTREEIQGCPCLSLASTGITGVRPCAWNSYMTSRDQTHTLSFKKKKKEHFACHPKTPPWTKSLLTYTEVLYSLPFQGNTLILIITMHFTLKHLLARLLLPLLRICPDEWACSQL